MAHIRPREHPHEGKVEVHQGHKADPDMLQRINDKLAELLAWFKGRPVETTTPNSGPVTIHVNLVALTEVQTKLTALEKSIMAIQDQLSRIDAYTTELADDIDRLAAQVASGADPKAIEEALKTRADALRLVADKTQPDVVPPAPEPLPPTP